MNLVVIGIKIFVFAIALATGLYSAHVFIPPTPGPLAAAAILEADLGLGALEDGTTYTDTGRSQDIGGPTSCGYSDATCAIDYPETVFFWAR